MIKDLEILHEKITLNCNIKLKNKKGKMKF